MQVNPRSGAAVAAVATVATVATIRPIRPIRPIRDLGLVVAASAVLGASGCATIVRGRQAPVSIESIPSGADVWLDGQLRGKTPLEVTMARESSHSVRFVLDGHEEVTLQTGQEISGGYVFADILFGVVWLAVDAITGAWYEPGPGPMRVLLSPKGQRCSSGECDYLKAAGAGGRP